MSTFPFFTGFLTKLVRTITLNRVLIWSFTALIGIAFYTLYENRTKLLSFVTAPSPANMVGFTFDVGQVTKEETRGIVRSDKTILGISVISTDLRLNEARMISFYSESPSISQVLERNITDGSNRLPLFTNNDQSNAQVIRLINGQFSCVPFDSTLQSKIYPELGSEVKAVCRSSIPSYYGYFSGFIEAYISERPSPEKELQLKIFIEKLANDVYFRDVLETQRPERVIERRGTP